MSGCAVTTEMISAGIMALEKSRRVGDDDARLVAAIFVAMSEMSSQEEDYLAFAAETILNINNAIETLQRCERRAIEHLDLIRTRR